MRKHAGGPQRLGDGSVVRYVACDGLEAEGVDVDEVRDDLRRRLGYDPTESRNVAATGLRGGTRPAAQFRKFFVPVELVGD